MAIKKRNFKKSTRKNIIKYKRSRKTHKIQYGGQFDNKHLEENIRIIRKIMDKYPNVDYKLPFTEVLSILSTNIIADEFPSYISMFHSDTREKIVEILKHEFDNYEKNKKKHAHTVINDESIKMYITLNDFNTWAKDNNHISDKSNKSNKSSTKKPQINNWKTVLTNAVLLLAQRYNDNAEAKKLVNTGEYASITSNNLSEYNQQQNHNLNPRNLKSASRFGRLGSLGQYAASTIGSAAASTIGSAASIFGKRST